MDGNRQGGQEGDNNHADDVQGITSHVYLPSRCGTFSFFTSVHCFDIPCSTETRYPMTSEALATMFHQDNFQELIQCFLFDQVHINDLDPPSSSKVTLEECPPFDSTISVYHTTMAIFYSPSNPCSTRGMHCKSIRSTPCWQKGAPHHDTVLSNVTLLYLEFVDLMSCNCMQSSPSSGWDNITTAFWSDGSSMLLRSQISIQECGWYNQTTMLMDHQQLG